MASEWLNRLSNCKLLVKGKKRGIHKGTRTSKSFGASFDFSDFRTYQPGDDIRQIDWNVYGRTEKLYIKRFLDEQELSVAVYLDSSISMQVIESKWKLAKALAASFSYIALMNDDRLSFVSAGLEDQVIMKRKGSLNSKQIYYHITELPSSNEATSFTASVERNLFKHSQLNILITDGLEDISRFELLFKRMGPNTKEIRLLQILASEELIPRYTKDVKLIDSENQSAVNVSMSERVLALYDRRLKEHNEKLARLCRRYGVSYLQAADEEGLLNILFTHCVKNGWLQGR